MLKTTITAGLLLAAAFLLADGIATPAHALMSKHRCYFCHDLHSATGGSLTKQATTQAVCLACHNVSVDGRTYGTDTDAVSTVAVAVHDSSLMPSGSITCLGCHDPHDYSPTDDPATTTVVETNDGDRDSYQNLDLVLRTITVMNTTLGDIDVDFTIADYSKPDGSGICQTCHTETRFQLNDGSGSNHPMGGSSTCTASCHTHANGFNRF